MISGAATSIPNPISGSPEVIMIIQIISTGAMGNTDWSFASLNTSPISRVKARPTFSASKCSTNF